LKKERGISGMILTSKNEHISVERSIVALKLISGNKEHAYQKYLKKTISLGLFSIVLN